MAFHSLPGAPYFLQPGSSSQFIGSFFFFFQTTPRAITMDGHTVLKCICKSKAAAFTRSLCSPAGEGILCAPESGSQSNELHLLPFWPMNTCGLRVLLLIITRANMLRTAGTPSGPTLRALNLSAKLLLGRGSPHCQIGKSCPWLRVGQTRGSREE